MSSLPGDSRFVTTRDARRLHCLVVRPDAVAEKTPAVVCIAGLGASGARFAPVIAELGRRTTAVTYDRAGLGRSDDDAAPPTLERMAGDLRDVLDGLALDEVVLVAHSWGGPIARTAACAEPERVRGLVLVDPSDEHAALAMSDRARAISGALARTTPALARLGVTRLVGRRLTRRLPAPVAREVVRQDFSPHAMRTAQRETALFRSELLGMRLPAEAESKHPAIILSAGRTPTRGPLRRHRALMLAAHGERARAHGWQLRILPGVGHDIPLEMPAAVVQAATELIESLTATDGRREDAL